MIWPAGLEGEKVLAALAEQESRSGVNNCPRFEQAYAPKGRSFTVQGRIYTGTGRYFVQSAWDRWGMRCAFSYSSWQIMYETARSLGYEGAPHLLWDDEIARPWVTKRLHQIIASGAISLDQIAAAWNGGNFKPETIARVRPYVDSVLKNYEALV
jgi:hypothetical protein